MTLDAETKRARNQKLSYRAIYLLKAFDVFRFKPVPQHIEGDTGSSWGVLGSIVLFIIVVTYFVSSFVRYTNQSPSVSVVTMYAPQYGEVISFSYSLKNPEVLNTPSTRSPSLTIDESYFLFSVVLTSAEERFRNDLNTMYLNTTLCQTEWQDARRTTSYTGYCPSQPGGECSAAVVCFDAKEAPPDAFLAGDCTISPNCRRVEVIATTCSELNWQLSHLTFVNYTYPVVPIPKAPPPSSWTMRLVAMNTTASGTLGRIEAAWGSKSWGWVCNDGFDLNETEVWCRNLGLPTKYAWQLSPSSGLYPLATDDQPYYVSASRCMNASSNAFFSDCGYAFINRTQDQDCGPSEAVGIYCGNVKPYEFEYALRNSSFPTAGLLVIRPKGTTNWATIMNDNFTQADGMAACRAMGYNVTGVQILPPGYYGRGQSNSYFVTKSNCDKTNKEALHECAEIQYADFRQKQVNKDIALDCSFIYYDLKWQYRLIDGITSTNDTTATGRGMVQVRPSPDAPWGGVCSFDWNGLSAGAFCRALGYAIPTARAIRQPAITSMYSPDNIYMEQMGCNATIGVLEDCPFKYFPPGSEWSEHSYDCGGFSPYATWDAQLNNIALAAFVDCNYECATPEEIQSMALSTSLLVNLSLSRAGVPTPTVAGVAVSTDFLQQGTFALAHYNTSVAPDFFYRFFQKVFYDMTLVSFTPQVKSLYQNFLGMNNTQSIPLVSLSLSMSSSTILENQAVQNLADLVGAVYAFYASIFGFLAIFLATWNKHKFYTKHPGWQRVQDDLTVKPGDANEDDEQKSISATPGETSNTSGTELAYPMLPLPDTEMQPV